MRLAITAAASAAALVLVMLWGPDYLAPAALILEGGSKPKVVAFLLLMTLTSAAAILLRLPDRRWELALLILPFLSNALHCVGVSLSGLPTTVEVFVFDGTKLEGDSPFHTHVGKSAVSTVLPSSAEPVSAHSGRSLCRVYPASVRAAELAVVTTSVVLAAAASRGPVTCFAGSLLAMSTVDGGGFSLPYINGCWLMALTEAARGGKVESATFGLAALLSPYAKMVLGTEVTARYYGSRWDRIHVIPVNVPKPVLTEAGARPLGPGVYAIRARDRCAFLRGLERGLRERRCRWAEVLLVPNIGAHLTTG